MHDRIARDMMRRGKWEEAEPHAREAAETWSGWGLLLGSLVDEHLGRWEDSENWVRAATMSYPSCSGYEWYFWCRRTGRGDVDKARVPCDAYFKAESLNTTTSGQEQLFLLAMCDGKPQEAIEHARKAAELSRASQATWSSRLYSPMHMVLLARELGDDEAELEAAAELRRLMDEAPTEDSDLATVDNAVLNLLDGESPVEESLAGVDAALAKLSDRLRCDCQYYLGRALELRGEQHAAEDYYREAVTAGPTDRYNATLPASACRRVTAPHTPSRLAGRPVRPQRRGQLLPRRMSGRLDLCAQRPFSSLQPPVPIPFPLPSSAHVSPDQDFFDGTVPRDGHLARDAARAEFPRGSQSAAVDRRRRRPD